MSGNDSVHARVPDRVQRNSDDTDELRSGVGSATAMERMKADRAMRHRHQHGLPAAGSACEEDASTER
jgi:hypothetical protein